eukprot:ANDGO_04451.mRNA.1 RNA-splicing ligase RtcB
MTDITLISYANVDQGTINQVNQVKRSLGTNAVAVAVMPDAHQGDEIPNGVVFETRVPVPRLVGTDIGCGVSLFDASFMTEQALAQVKAEDAHAFTSRFQQVRIPADFSKDLPFSEELGSLGGGNHFAEIVRVESVVDTKLAEQIHPGMLLMMIHSGSRGYGAHASKVPLARYMENQDAVVDWAKLNRQLVAYRFKHALTVEPLPQPHTHEVPEILLNVSHNWVEQTTASTFVHRKGAVSTTTSKWDSACWVHNGKKLMVLPGSRGSASFLLTAVDNPEVHNACLNSIAHGAGRKLKRSDCKALFTDSKYKQSSIELDDGTTATVCCANENLKVQEHPDAYKDVTAVVEDLVTFGCVNVAAVLRPVFTYKD